MHININMHVYMYSYGGTANGLQSACPPLGDSKTCAKTVQLEHFVKVSVTEGIATTEC